MTDQMTSNALDTADRIVVAPEVSIDGAVRATADECLADFQRLMPQLDSIIERAVAVGNEYSRMRLTIARVADDDTLDELLGVATGWEALWQALVDLGARLNGEREFPYMLEHAVQD